MAPPASGDFITLLLRRVPRDTGNYRRNIGNSMRADHNHAACVSKISCSGALFAFESRNSKRRENKRSRSARNRVSPSRVRLITIPARQNDVTLFPRVRFSLANTFKLLRRTIAGRFLFVCLFVFILPPADFSARRNTFPRPSPPLSLPANRRHFCDSPSFLFSQRVVKRRDAYPISSICSATDGGDFSD